MDNDLTWAVVVIVAINAMLFLGQAAILDVNPLAPNFFQCQGSLIGQYEQTGCTTTTYTLNNSNPTAQLPSGETSVSPETGNIFTDSFTGLKTWFLDTTGLSYLINIISAPYNLLMYLGLPGAFTFAIGTLWYSITLFLIVAWLFGR